jgi:hypothetical protein
MKTHELIIVIEVCSVNLHFVTNSTYFSVSLKITQPYWLFESNSEIYICIANYHLSTELKHYHFSTELMYYHLSTEALSLKY